MADADRSFQEILKDIMADVREIVRLEVRLAKAAVREEGSRAGPPALLAAAGGLACLFAVLFILLASVDALSTVMPHWAAETIVGLILAVTGATTLATSRRQFKTLYPLTAPKDNNT